MKIWKIAKSLFVNLIVIMLMTVVFFCAAEMIARAAMYARTGDIGFLTRFYRFEPIKVYDLKMQSHLKGKDIYYKGLPNVTYKGSDGETVSYNSKGFRSREFSDKKNTARIACFGGSSTWGAGSNNDETWPAYLGRYLDDALPGSTEVINAGFGSYNTTMVLNLIKNEFVTYDPDMIILYCGYNDHTGGRVQAFSNNSRAQILIRNINIFLRKNSSFYYLLQKVVSKGVKFGAVAEGERMLETYNRNINEIIDICKARGIKLVLVKQPLYVKSTRRSSAESGELYSKYYKDPYFNEKTYDVIERDLRKNTPNSKYGRTYYYQWLIFKAIDGIRTRDRDVIVIDFANTFIEKQENGKDLFLDVVHLYPEGNELLAENIFKNEEFRGALQPILSKYRKQ